jgi:dipeptidase E
MKRLFLASGIDNEVVAEDLFRKIGKTAPVKTLCIKTATEDKERDSIPWYGDDKRSLSNAGFSLIEYTLTGKTKAELEKALSEVEVVYVSGGNTFYLLQESQKVGFIPLIQQRVKEGLIYIGSSAGSVIASPNIEPVLGLDNVELAPDIKGYAGYDLVNACVLPHWGSDNFKNRYLENTVDQIFKEKGNVLIALNNLNILK